MNKYTLTLVTVMLSLLAAHSVSAEEQFDASDHLETFLKNTRAPGVSLTVIRAGKVIGDFALGLADIEQNVAMSGDTVVRVGSISKTITAVAAVRLASNGALDLDEPVSSYLPDFSGPGRVVTVRQLASHSSGVRGYADDEYISNTQYSSVYDSLIRFGSDDLLAQPGEEFHYTSAGFTLLSATLAAVQRDSFETVMTEQVWGPLALASTGLDNVLHIVPNRGRYYVISDTGLIQNGVQVDNSFKWAGGGMLSSTHDLARYGSALSANQFLTMAEKSLLFTPGILNNGEATAYGLGWYVDMQSFLRAREDKLPPELFTQLMTQVADRKLVWHSGTAVGSVALLMLEPAENLVLALAVNLGGVEKETIILGLDLITAFKAVH